MRRSSRAAIEAEIARLQAELANTQPDVLKLASRNCRKELGVHLDFDGLSGPWVGDVRVYDRTGETFGIVAAAPLRDWLNYHFPKENA